MSPNAHKSSQADNSDTDRRVLGPRFQARLAEVLSRSGLSKTAFAAQIGIDRSALSQLLSQRDPRLPRAETLVAIAQESAVSLDWLLGLTQDDTNATELADVVEIEERAAGSEDSRLLEWRREAQGAKIRYVPAYLPDLFRLPALTAMEREVGRDVRLESRLATERQTLELSRQIDSDIEICMPRQRLELLATGAGTYAMLPEQVRRAQLEHMRALTEELYPSVRCYLFDLDETFAAPYTVFGAKRAALFLGEMYFVLNAKTHIDALRAHFDRLIRAAVVDAWELPDFLDQKIATLRPAPR
ncbi:MAG: helix-turn-helix transcriptional regulator [Pseudomonadota bacterium]